MVANKIYTKTHEGLTDLVSARVASQVLDNGLRARRYSAETVTVGQMASILKGPVMNELSGSLPRAGLERSLKKLLKTLKTLPPEKTSLKTATAPDPEEADVSVDETADGAALNEAVMDKAVMDEAVSEAAFDEAVAEHDLEADETQAADVGQVEEVSTAEVSSIETSNARTSSAETPHAGAAEAETAVQTEPVSTLHEHGDRSAFALSASAPSAAQVLERATVAPPVVRAPLEPAARDRVMLGFAELEHVKMVAAFENGGVSSVLGQGFEVAALSRLGTLGLKLLGRSGDLRTFYVAHAQGQLFLFPFGVVTLMLIGSSELNLGLVFATLQKLKEEL